MMRRRQRLAVSAAEVVVSFTVCFVEADQGDGRPGGLAKRPSQEERDVEEP
jgi:hypothetical protein